MLIVKKVAEGLFDFCESSNGTDYDGKIYGGNSVKLSYTNDTLTVSVDGGEKENYPLSGLNYDDGNEIVGFATMNEFVIALKDAGFTGNFNTPQAGGEAVYYIGGQDDTGFLDVVEKKNTIGVDFTFSRTGTGLFEFPQFDKTKHLISWMAITDESTVQKIAFYDNDDIKNFKTYIDGEGNDSFFFLGGWIKIEVYE